MLSSKGLIKTTKDHLGILPSSLTSMKIEDFDEFLVINVASYNVLLGRPWMHKNVVLSLTYHQCVKYPLAGGQGTIVPDIDSFSSVEDYHVKA